MQRSFSGVYLPFIALLQILLSLLDESQQYYQKSALVAPILIATAKPCSISSTPMPMPCKPTIFFFFADTD